MWSALCLYIPSTVGKNLTSVSEGGGVYSKTCCKCSFVACQECAVDNIFCVIAIRVFRWFVVCLVVVCVCFILFGSVTWILNLLNSYSEKRKEVLSGPQTVIAYNCVCFLTYLKKLNHFKKCKFAVPELFRNQPISAVWYARFALLLFMGTMWRFLLTRWPGKDRLLCTHASWAHEHQYFPAHSLILWITLWLLAEFKGISAHT